MTTLDEIQARADKATAGPWCLTYENATHPRVWGNLDEDGAEADMVAKTCRSAADAVFIAAAREDVPRLVAALRAVEAVHRKAPIYSTEAGDCKHGDDCEGIELSGYESLYCPDEITGQTCTECGDLARDNMDGDLPAWPCPTIRAIREALG